MRSTMLNRLLSALGLVTIRRAASLSATLHEYYAASVASAVRADFGVQPKEDFKAHAKAWWVKEFKALLSTGAGAVQIDSVPEMV